MLIKKTLVFVTKILPYYATRINHHILYDKGDNLVLDPIFLHNSVIKFVSIMHDFMTKER